MKKRGEYPSVMWILGILLLTLVIIGPLARTGFFVSDDGDWMIIRLSAFYQSLREGQFPVRFLGRLNYSYGYPVSNFLYPGFLYIGSLFHAIGFGFVDAVKMILALSFMGATACVYAWLRRRFTSLAASAGAMSFLFAPYLVFDLYTRGSVGEMLAILGASLLFVFAEYGLVVLLPFAVGFTIISHNTLALVFLVFFLVWLLYEKKWSYIWPVLLGVGLATFFWFPAIWERKYVVFDKTVISNPFLYFASGSALYLLGYIPAVAFVGLIRQWDKVRKQKAVMYYIVLFALITFFSTPLSAPFWTFQPVSKVIQFPYRLLAVNLFVGAWLVALFTSCVSQKTQKIVLFVVLIVGLLTTGRVAWESKFVDKPEGFFSTNEATTTVANEYMPRWVSDVPENRSDHRVEVYQGSAILDIHKASTQKVDISIDAKEPVVVQINSIYYPGWGVVIDDAPALIDYKNTRGLIRVSVPTGKHRIKAEFRETISRFVADCFSVLSFIIYMIWFARQWKRRI